MKFHLSARQFDYDEPITAWTRDEMMEAVGSSETLIPPILHGV
jgi:hypothetical protein